MRITDLKNELSAQFKPTTTVDLDELARYLSNLPTLLQFSVHQGYSRHVCYCSAHLDGVDFWLRGYLSGRTKTLHRAFWEIRGFLAYNQADARALLPVALDCLERELLDREYYELLPRYQKARRRIAKTFQL